MTTSFDNAEALWKIDRQGQRSKPVLERHKGKSESIASFDTTLPPKADGYHLQYGELRARIIDSQRTNAAAEHEIGLLVQEMRQWHGPLEMSPASSWGASPAPTCPTTPSATFAR
jgi:hypothetical protein